MTRTSLLRITVICLLAAGTYLPLQAGWTQAVAHTDGEKELPALPDIELITTNKKDGIVIQVTNNTGIDLVYRGYRKDFPQLFYKTKVKGKWQDDNWHWCGTGMERHTLKQGESRTFKLGKRNAPSRIYTIFTEAGKHTKPRVFSLVELYSNGN